MKLQAGNMESMDNDIVDDDDDDEDDDDDDDDDFMSEQNRVPCGFYLWWTVVTLSWKHILTCLFQMASFASPSCQSTFICSPPFQNNALRGNIMQSHNLSVETFGDRCNSDLILHKNLASRI